MTPEAKAQQELITATILKVMGTCYRVDTHAGAVQWWFCAKTANRFIPVEVTHVWRLGAKALWWAEIHAPAFMVSAAMKSVQQQTPLLTFEEWATRTKGVPAHWFDSFDSQLSNHPHWRAA